MGRLWKALHEIFIISGFSQVLLTKFKIADLLSSAAIEPVFCLFGLCQATHRIVISGTGIELVPPALEAQSCFVLLFFLNIFLMWNIFSLY